MTHRFSLLFFVLLFAVFAALPSFAFAQVDECVDKITTEGNACIPDNQCSEDDLKETYIPLYCGTLNLTDVQKDGVVEQIKNIGGLLEEKGGFWNNIFGWFKPIGDTASRITKLIANIGAIAGLIFSGLAPILGIVIGVSYLAMAVLGLVATGLFVLLREIILSTASIPVIPGANEVVTKGWEFSRDFVSMLFIVILVFIGLATILR